MDFQIQDSISDTIIWTHEIKILTVIIVVFWTSSVQNRSESQQTAPVTADWNSTGKNICE